MTLWAFPNLVWQLHTALVMRLKFHPCLSNHFKHPPLITFRHQTSNFKEKELRSLGVTSKLDRPPQKSEKPLAGWKGMPGLSRNLHKFLIETSWVPFQLSSMHASAITLPNSRKAFSILLHTGKHKRAVWFCSLDQMFHWPVKAQSTNCDHGGWEVGSAIQYREGQNEELHQYQPENTANFCDSTYLKLNIDKM